MEMKSLPELPLTVSAFTMVTPLVCAPKLMTSFLSPMKHTHREAVKGMVSDARAFLWVRMRHKMFPSSCHGC
jgi:hypothetical protein